MPQVKQAGHQAHGQCRPTAAGGDHALLGAALAAQKTDKELASRFAPLAKALASGEHNIIAEFKAVQGKRADLGGYHRVDPVKCAAVMRPSATFNAVLDSFERG